MKPVAELAIETSDECCELLVVKSLDFRLRFGCQAFKVFRLAAIKCVVPMADGGMRAQVYANIMVSI